MLLQLGLGTFLGLLASVRVCRGAECVSTTKRGLQEVRTMQGGLVTAEDAVDLLAGLVGGAANGDPVGTNMLKMGE